MLNRVVSFKKKMFSSVAHIVNYLNIQKIFSKQL